MEARGETQAVTPLDMRCVSGGHVSWQPSRVPPPVQPFSLCHSGAVWERLSGWPGEQGGVAAQAWA